MKTSLVTTLVGAVALTWLAGCSATGEAQPEESIKIRQITQSAHCGLTGPGVAYLRSSEERETMLDVSGQNMATDAVRNVDLSREDLVIVTLGQKPTGGYSVGLTGAHEQERVLDLVMQVSAPGPDMMVTQVITSPCVVLAVEKRSWKQVRVQGVAERELIRNLEN